MPRPCLILQVIIVLTMTFLPSLFCDTFQKTPKKPVIHMTTSTGEITYYSSSFDDPFKFDFKVLSWAAYLRKYQYGWRIVEGKWVRETLRPDKSSTPVTRVFIPPSWRSGGGGIIFINNKTLSAPPSKK